MTANSNNLNWGLAADLGYYCNQPEVTPRLRKITTFKNAYLINEKKF